MSRSVLDHWWPVTYDHGLIRSDIESVAHVRREAYRDAGLQISLTMLDAPLADCLSALEPLSPAPTKELYLATTFGWTAFFANGCRGSDPSLPMRQLAEALGTMAVRACATRKIAQFLGVILEVYDTKRGGADAHGNCRTLAAINDGGRWVFKQSGIPYPFEDISHYDAPRFRDRFTKAMLADYLDGLGAGLLMDDTLHFSGACRGILLERPACGSACKKAPLSGVIGVQKGPLISMA